MGYDCTLHVIDPAAVRRFDRWFSGSGKINATFERLYSGTAWRDGLIAAIEAGDDARREVMKGLLLWSATAAPHTTSRGWALSLWDYGDPGDALDLDALPYRLCASSVDALLPKTLTTWPALCGLTPGFTGNYDVGAYIPPEDVPEARAYIAQLLEQQPGEHRRLEPLLDVLMVAEARKMAYWEATDLLVTQAKPAWLDAVRPQLSTPTLDVGLSRPTLVARGPDWLLLTQYPEQRTVLIEGAGQPEPTLRSFSGVFLANATMAGPRTLVGWGDFDGQPRQLYRFDLDEAGPTPIAFDAAGTWSPHSTPYAAPVGPESLLLVPGGYPAGHAPVILRDGVVEPSGLPPSEGRPFGTGSFGWRPLGEARALLEWDRQAYLWHDGTFSPLGHEISLEPSCTDGWQVPDGCLAIDNRVFTYLDPEGARQPIAPDIPNTMHASRGPGGAWILAQGDHKQGDLFKVVWPNEIARGTRAKFGRLNLRWLIYIDGIIWAQDGPTAHRVPWDQVARLKRSKRER
jgi:hypothetical protein